MGWQSFNAAGLPTVASLGSVLPETCEGRLTTESGVPVSTSDRTAQGTIFFTPCTPDGAATASGYIALYNGAALVNMPFTELSYTVAATSGQIKDLFVDYNGGTLQIVASAAWASDTTRTDALGTQSGIIVKSGSPALRWVGTYRASGANVTADSLGGVTSQVGGQRFVWNAFNQVRRGLVVIDTTNSWSYTTNTIRQANGAAGNQVEYVTGDAALTIDAFVHGIVFLDGNLARAAKVGVGVDSTTTFSEIVQGGYNTTPTGSGSIYAPIFGRYVGQPGLGYHFISWNEKGADGTCTFLGDNGGDSQQSGAVVTIHG